ncbi:MAG: glutathione S-transferase family protein [Gammaproteobacteria bacterium]|nr:glutathione S-transferase family protein [Gammaproteobacteria bacterium]
MILYGFSISPFVKKVLAFASEKGVTLEQVPVAPNTDNPGFLQSSPFRKIPSFSDGEFNISDSSAIVAYLEAKFPQPALIPAAPAERARAIWFDEFADTIVGPVLGKVFFNRVVAPVFLGQSGDEAVAAATARDEVPRLFDYLEGVIADNGFLVGDALTLADIAVTSNLINFAHANVTVDPAVHPTLARYTAAMCARPSFATILAAEKAMLAPAG